MKLPSDNMTKPPSGYIVEIRNLLRRRPNPHTSTLIPEWSMSVNVTENPSNTAGNENSDSNSRNSDLRLRCYCMRNRDAGLT